MVTGLNGPEGIALSGAKLFVANHGRYTGGAYVANSGSIGEYTTSGTTVNTALITGLTLPRQVALSGEKLFVTNSFAGTVGEYTTSGSTVNATLIAGLAHPDGIVVIPQPHALPGDANGDGAVNFGDLLILAQNYGKASALAQGDFNADGSVGFNDLLILAQHYGIGTVAAPAVSVPEPMSLPMLGVVAGSLWRTRRSRA